MKHRYMALFLVALLLPCCLAVPSKAANTSAAMQNLLPAPNYQVGINGSYESLSSPFADVTSGTEISFAWQASSNVSLDYIYLTLNVGDLPGLVSLYLNGSDATVTERTPIGVNGDYVQYRFAVSGYQYSSLYFTIKYSSGYTGDISIFSCYGVANTAETITNVDYMVYQTVVNTTDGLVEQSLLTEQFGAALPFSYYHDDIYGAYQLFGGDLYITLTPDSHNLQFADSITYLLRATAFLDVTVSLQDPTYKNVVKILEPQYQFYDAESILIKYQDHIPFDFVEVTVDLSGYDLSKYNLVLCLNVEDYPMGATIEEIDGFYFGCSGIVMTPVYEPQPWYVSFWNWLGTQFDRIGSWFVNLGNTIASWCGSIVSTIEKWGQSILDVLDPDPEAGADAKEEAAEKVDQIDDLTGQMGSVTKPDLTGSGGISDIISPGDMTSYTTFLASMVNAPYISSVVMLSLILSLAAYVLFGKRG